jgi:subtilase family serine protease
MMAQSFAPEVRIVNRIDENQTVTLKGNTHPWANARNDRGRVSPDLPMTDLVLVLSRSPQQQAAFDKFVASQYESGSPDYHQWLTPEEVGEKFGPAETDIATISNWLTGHGFSIDEVSKDRMSIRFSGTAGEVESTFHTEIHNLEVKGEAHIGNMTDPQIPAALVPAVVGVKALHNFFPRPQHKLGSKVTFNRGTGKWQRVASTPTFESGTPESARPLTAHPEFGITVGTGSNAYPVEDVAPYDFATIYNVLPLWNASSPIDGTGQTIAIAGTSDIVLTDVSTFRSTFGLPAYTSSTQPRQIVANGTDPGTCTGTTGNCTIDDLRENTLDVEWSGAVAKGAQIVLVVSGANSATTDTVYSSAHYVVNSSPLLANILSVSYGECELFNGTASNAAYNSMWQSAYTEGIAVFVAAGDQGSASCDGGMDGQYGTPWAAQYGLSVSGLASTPYNTAVGGTDLNWGATASPYWGSTNNGTTGANAVGYIPEVPWNDTCTNPLVLSYLESVAKNVSYSGTVKDTETACNFIANDAINIFETYVYQGTNTPVDVSEYVDAVGGSGGKSNCSTNTSVVNGNSITPGTCTSGYAKPSWQTALTPGDGARDLPDVSFFASNGFLDSAYLICVTADGACVTPPLTSVTTEPTAQEVGGTSVSSPAMAGVMALINQKARAPQGNPNTALYTLAGKQNYSNCKSETVTNSSSCYFNDIDTGTNAMPCDYGAPDGGILNGSYIGQQPGIISPNCTPVDSGDTVAILSGYSAVTGYDLATGLGSLNVANVVNAWSSIVGSAKATVTVSPTSSSLKVNTALSVPVTVAGSSGTPTGTVTLSGGGYTSAAGTLSGGSYTFTIPADSLSKGTDTLTVTYNGDPTYAVATGTAQVTVTLLTASVTVNPSLTSLFTNQSLTVSGTVTGTGGTPSGTVKLTGGGYTSAAVSLSSGSYSVTVPAGKLTAGSDVLTVTYSGDANFASTTGTTTVTVTTFVLLTPAVAVTPGASSIDTGQSLGVTGNVTGTGGTATGAVTLTSGSYTSAAVTLSSSGAFSFTIPPNSLSAGTDTLTVTYTGDSTYNSNTGTASVTVTASVYALSATTPAGIAPGASATSTVTVSTSTGYAGAVTLTCALTSSPTGATDLPTCSGASSAVNLSSGTTSGTATVTVNTTAASSSALAWPRLGKGRGWTGGGAGALLAFLVFMGIPARRRSWRSMLGVLVAMVVLGSLAGCGGSSGGGGGQSNPGTTAGAYTFTVTGTGSPSVTPAPTTTFIVTVN